MNLKKVFQSGLGLAEVMIATSIMGGLTLVLMRMNEQGQQGVARVEKGLEASDFDREIINYAATKDGCSNTLGTPLVTSITSSTGVSITAIKNDTNQTVISVNDKRGTVKLTQMKIHSYDSVKKTASFSKYFEFPLTRDKKVTREKTTKLAITTNVSGTNVSSCIATVGVSDDIWTVDSYGIFYNHMTNPTVAIGKSANTNTGLSLDVEGDVRIGTSHSMNPVTSTNNNMILGGLSGFLSDTKSWLGTPIRNSAIIAGYESVLVRSLDDSVSGDAMTIVGGAFNTLKSENGTILGGDHNYSADLTAVSSAILSGFDNTISGAHSTTTGWFGYSYRGNNSILGGASNYITASQNSSIVGGYANQISTVQNSVVVGGRSNSVSGLAAVVVGGYSNSASGANSIAQGGYLNRATGDNSFNSGGHDNLAQANSSFMAGGVSNTIQSAATNAFIGGGQLNNASGIGSFIAGGNGNFATNSYSFASGFAGNASGERSFVAGGSTNTSSGYASFATGFSNVSSGDYSMSGGYDSLASGRRSFSIGYQNQATGTSTFAGGGNNNAAWSEWAFVGGGRWNSITVNGHDGFIGGGENNDVTEIMAFVGGGIYNTASGNSSFVGGGQNNLASNSASFVGGGFYNTVSGFNSAVIGGQNNSVGTGQFPFILGGRINTVTGYLSGAIGSYNGDVIGSESILIGGASITVNGSGSVVLGDNFNSTISFSQNDTLIGRFQNGYYFCTSPSCATRVEIGPSGTGWGGVSDRNLKEKFKDVDGEDILKRISNLDITSWQFKSSEKDITRNMKRNIGPVAQDFYKWFAKEYQLESSEKMIFETDVRGVLLVGTKALEKRTRELKDENVKLTSRIKTLEDELKDLKKQFERLSKKLDKK